MAGPDVAMPWDVPPPPLLNFHSFSDGKVPHMTDRPDKISSADAIPPAGHPKEMRPRPRAEGEGYKASGKLDGKVALITGGDSGIGRAVAIAFAKEGADVAIVYLDEHDDAERDPSAGRGGRAGAASLIAGDIGDEAFCREAGRRRSSRIGRLDILVNNAAEQHPQEATRRRSARSSCERTFRTNIFAMFYLTKAALPHLRRGRGDHQHDVGDRLSRQPAADRLRVDQGRDRGVHALARGQAGGRRASASTRVAPGPDLDAADPGDVPPSKVGEFGSDARWAGPASRTRSRRATCSSRADDAPT